ncbi:MAG: helix-turn-helix transcriptional regulator [Niveispirillum sp.]|nr:helix-turn-helix transcriptional regulator [Niveispirillum sp.]
MVAIGIDPAGLHNRLSLGDSSRLVSSAATRIHRDPLLTAIMTTLWHESQLHGLSGDFFDHCIRRIFTRLGELVNVQPTRRRDRPLTDRQIKMVNEFVETHLVDGPERMAAMVDLSPDHFSRAFRASLGTSPLRYVSDRRVRRVKAMLLDPSVPITNIAMALGYATPSHFTESFHKATGTTPSQWRRDRR